MKNLKLFCFWMGSFLAMLPLYAFAQEGTIQFADATVKSLCVAAWDTDGDGELSYDEAAAVTDLGTSFAGTTIKSFDELQYFTSLTEIPAEAFKGCNSLASVTLPPSVKSIGESAFRTCYKLASFDFEGIERIGANAFYACNRLASIDLPKSVVSVDSKAFFYNTKLTSATIHSPQAVIAADAFTRCGILTEMTMPAVLATTFVPSTVTSLHLVFEPESAYTTFCSGNSIDFSQTEGVTAYTVSGYLDGSVYLMEATDVPAGTGLVVHATPGERYELHPGSGAALTVPNHLVGVESATTVAATADGKRSLVLAQPGDAAAFTALAEDAEVGAHEAYLALGEEIVTAGETYPTIVSDRAPVEVITFADATVKSLCVAAWDTDGDGELSYDEAAAVTDLGTSFAGTAIKSFDELQYFTSLTEIPAEAFKGCNSLASVMLPPSVKSIGESAFRTCYKLTTFDFEGIERIGANAFYACTHLAAVDLPKSVVSVGSKAFFYNNDLPSATIRSPRAEIADDAFTRCAVLTEMTIPAVLAPSFVPSSVTSLHLVFEPETAYTTFCSGNSIDFSQTEGVTAYTVSGYLDGSVYLMEATDVPAGTGLVVHATPGERYELHPGSGAALTVPNHLVGVESATTVAATADGKRSLVLAQPGDAAAFTALAEDAEVGAHEAYLALGEEIVTAGETYPTIVSDRAPVEVITFADATVKSLCVAAWDTDGDGELSYDEAAAVTDLGTSFAGTTIKSFDELQFFTSLTEIPAEAFKGCNSLASVTLPPSVKSIGESAFRTCYKLTSFDFEGIESIGANAFYACNHLASIDLPKSVVSVGPNAFFYNTQLTSVTIRSPHAVVADKAFNSCRSLTEMTIPAVLGATFVPSTVTSLHLVFEPESAYTTFCSGNSIDFSQTEGVTAYTVSGYLDGSVYLMEATDVPAGTGLVVHATPGERYELHPGSGAALTVPNHLVGVESATTVAATADGKRSLVLAQPGDAAAFTALAEDAEVGAHEAYLALGEEIVTAGETYPTIVSDRAPVEVITFADATVKSLCVAAWDTDGDGELSYDEAAAVTDLGTSFAGTAIKSFDELQYFTSLTEIPAGAFSGCSDLATVTLTASVNAIGETAFQGSALTAFDFSSIETIGSNAFNGCTGLVTLDLPEVVSTVGTQAFQNCTALTSVTVHSPNTVVADDAFGQCASLAEMTIPAVMAATFVPATVTSLQLVFEPETAYSTFCSPNALDFSQTEGVTAYTVSGYLDGSVYLMETADVPAGTGLLIQATPGERYELHLGSGAALTTPNYLVGVENATTISASADGNTHLVLAQPADAAAFTALTEDVEIGAHEAYLSIADETITAGETYPTIVSDRVPVKVIDFADATVKSLCVAAWDTDGDGELSYDEAAAVTDLGTSFAGTTIKSFDELQYFTSLTEIPAEAFKACKNLTSVTLPSSVKSIGASAFHTCYKLTTFDFKEVETIGAGAFYSCIVLTAADLPESVVSVGSKAFYYNIAMTNASVASPQAEIAADAFASCRNLVEMTIPAVLASTFVPAMVTSLHLMYEPEATYNTFCSPNALDFSQTEGVTAYTVSGYLDGSVYLMETADVPAGTGLLIQATPGERYELHLGSGAALTTPNYLVGVENATTIPASADGNTHLVLAQPADAAAFTALTEDVEIGAHEAYISIADETITAGETYPTIVSDRVPVKVIDFADATVKSLCVAAWDTDGDGELSYDEAAAVTDLGTSFAGTTIQSFDELQYFTSLTEIPAEAFKACKSLTSVTLPPSVKSIGASAFYTCYGLTAFDFEGVENISASAFYACTRLTSIDLPKSVVNVGPKAFFYNTRLTNATIHSPNAVVADNAFASCNVLSEMTVAATLPTTFVPSSVSTVHLIVEPTSAYSTFASANAIDFSGAEGLKAYTVSSVQNDEAYLLEITDVPAGMGVVLVGTPGEVYVVNPGSNSVVEQNNLLVGVQENTTVESAVGDNRNLVLTESEENATFDVVSAPTEVKAHEAYLQVAENRLGGNNSVALSIVSELPSENIIFVDANVKAICVSAWDTDGDGELNFEEAAAVTTLDKLFKKQRIGDFPELQYFTGLTEISDSAFANSSLTSIILPQTVKKINKAAFYACYYMKSIKLPDGLTTISDAAFNACTGLTTLELPETTVNLESRCFYYCTKLQSINLPKDLKTIPAHMLRYCTSLDSISIPASVQSVGTYAFSNCSSLRAVRMPVNLVVTSLPATVERFYYFYTPSSEWSTFCSPNALGFSTTENAEAYVVPSYEDGTALLQRVDAVPANTGIVLHCSTPGEEVIFSKGTDVAPENLLKGLLKPTYVAPTTPYNTHLKLDSDNLMGLGFYPIPEDVIFEAYTAYLALPERVDIDMLHISLGDIIVFADDNVKALCVSNWDTNGDGELSMAEAAAVTSLESVFTSKTTIKTFEELKYFTGLTSIGNNAFSGCTALKSIVVPENVTSFGNNAFKNCRNLSAINVPENLTSIGNSCFSSCSLLESIVIPETVKSVGDNAFQRCSKLATVTVPARLYVNSFPTTVTTYYYTITLEEEYETLCSGYNLNLVNGAGLQAFTTPLYKDGRIKMSRQNNVPANTGVLLHGAVGEQYVMTAGTAATLDNLFVGVLNDTQLTPVMGESKVFCLANGSHGFAFYPLDAETTLAGTHAYLPLPASDVTDVDHVLMSLLPDIDDPVIRAKQHRGIASSIGELDSDSNDEWYTLTGTKLNGRPVQRGVYIHNGKKVSVK